MVFWKKHADAEVMLFLNIRCMIPFLKAYNLLVLFSKSNDWTSDLDPSPRQDFFHGSLDVDGHWMVPYNCRLNHTLMHNPAQHTHDCVTPILRINFGVFDILIIIIIIIIILIILIMYTRLDLCECCGCEVCVCVHVCIA